MLQHAFEQALQAAMAIGLSHSVCVGIVMYLDLSGKWAKYSMNKNRSVTVQDYVQGMKCFAFDLAFLFLPFMTACLWYRADKIDGSTDSMSTAFAKLAIGYVLGKVWAFVIHYVLHFPSLYQIHRVHHRDPRKVVASAAWEDHPIEYVLMELPSFAICILVFPTHFWVHLLHFCLHGYDGAAGHSGFKAPGLLGWLFDGEYHYYHHAQLKVNYAEIEFIDKAFGCHHSQKSPRKKQFE